MPYIKPNGSDDTYQVKAIQTMTQSGYKAVRFSGEEIPNEYNKGFKYYNDEDVLISDFSSYIYFYSPNVYSVEEDEVIIPKPNNTPPADAYIPVDFTSEKIAQLNARVNELEPYTETKEVYIDDTEAIFDIPKNGSISAWLEVDGIRTPCEYEVIENKIRVYFEPLEMVGTVTLQIQ